MSKPERGRGVVSESGRKPRGSGTGKPRETGSVGTGRMEFTDGSCVDGILGAELYCHGAKSKGRGDRRQLSSDSLDSYWGLFSFNTSCLPRVVLSFHESSLRVWLPGKVPVFQPTRLKMLSFRSWERTLRKWNSLNILMHSVLSWSRTPPLCFSLGY